MAAHFTMPAYQKRLNPDLEEKDMQPACTSRELIDGLLRKLLGFQGLVITDQTAEYVMKYLKQYGYEPEWMESGVAKGKVADFKKRYDAVMIFADISGFAQTNSVRLMWPHPMSNCYPWYIHDVPTVFTSFNYTNHLIDVSRVPAFINAYNNQPETIEETIKRIAGLEPFEGQYDEDVWCGTGDTRF